MSDNKTSSGGIGVFGLLGVSFVILKLCKVIDWSWWYVTLPFWGGFALIGIILIIGIISTIIADFLDATKRTKLFKLTKRGK